MIKNPCDTGLPMTVAGSSLSPGGSQSPRHGPLGRALSTTGANASACVV